MLFEKLAFLLYNDDGDGGANAWSDPRSHSLLVTASRIKSLGNFGEKYSWAKGQHVFVYSLTYVCIYWFVAMAHIFFSSMNKLLPSLPVK